MIIREIGQPPLLSPQSGKSKRNVAARCFKARRTVVRVWGSSDDDQ
jgi:hypothetical protein